MSIKNLFFLTNAKILSECECTMYDPVYSTPFQVYYKTAIFNPESHSESYEVLSIKKTTKQNDERAAFFLSLCLCYRRLSSDKTSEKERRTRNVPHLQCGPATARSRRKSDNNKYRHPYGILGGNYFPHAYTQAYV